MLVTNGLCTPGGVQAVRHVAIHAELGSLTLKKVPVAETRDGLTDGKVSGCSMKSLTRPAVELLTHALMLS